MTVQELIEILEDFDGEAEVRLAQQPSWPFEYGIGEVAEVRNAPKQQDELQDLQDFLRDAWSPTADVDPTDRRIAMTRTAELEREIADAPTVIYIGEGPAARLPPGRGRGGARMEGRAMSYEQNKSRAETLEVLAPYGFTAREVDQLHRYETTLHRLAEEQANGYQDRDGNEDTRARDASEKLQDRTEELARQVIAGRLPVRFNYDPRGGAIRFTVPGRHNSWDGETWGLHW